MKLLYTRYGVIAIKYDAAPRLAYQNAVLINGSVTHHSMCVQYFRLRDGDVDLRRFILRFSRSAIRMIIGHALSRQSMNRSRRRALWPPAGDCPPHSIPRVMQTSAPITTSSTSGESRQTTQQTLRYHSSAQIRMCMAFSRQLGRWRSLGLPPGGNHLFSLL